MQYDRIVSKRKDKVVYKNGDNAIKVFDIKYSKTEVLNEALNQARIEETGLRIPRIREVTNIDGKWAIVSDFIAGKTLESLIREIPEEEDNFLDKFIEIQMLIHTKRSPLLSKLKDKLNRKISNSSLDDDIKLSLYSRLESMPMYNNVCHGDLDPSNIIVTEENEIYILDWSHATQGNPAQDAARTYLLFVLKGQNKMAEKYLKFFSEKSGIERDSIKKWLPLVAASESLTGKQEDWPILKTFIDSVEE